MIIFFFGKNDFKLKKKTTEILNHYKSKKTGLSFIFINCLEKNFNQLKEANSQTSLFKEKKLILIENLFKNNEFKNTFLKNIKIFLETENIIIISEDQDLSIKDKLVSFLIKEVKYQRFDKLNSFQIKNWLEKEIKKQNAKIEPEALSLLLNNIGDDLWKLNNEIKKLCNFSKTITKKNVLLLTNLKTESDIFKTIEAIADKDKKKAIKFIHHHLKKGDAPLYLLSMISYQFKNLIILKEIEKLSFPEIVQKSKLSPFVIKKALPLLVKFSFKDLKKIYHKIFEIDSKIKIGKIEAEAGLEVLIADL